MEKYIDQRIDLRLDTKLVVPKYFVVDSLIETNFFSDSITITPRGVVDALSDPESELGKAFFQRISSAKEASHAVLMQTAVSIARAARETLPCEAAIAEHDMIAAHRNYLVAEARARAGANVEEIDLKFQHLPPAPDCKSDNPAGPIDALAGELQARLKDQVEQTERLQTASDAIDERLKFWRELDRNYRTELTRAYEAYAKAVKIRNEKRALARFAEAWAGDVELAAQAYVQAGLDTALLMAEQSRPHPPALHERPSGMVHYDRWTECFLPVFFGQPYSAGEATCDRLKVMETPLSLSEAALKSGMGKMPRTLTYRIIDLDRRLDAFFMRLAKAAGRMVAPSTAELLEQIYKPERISREKLNQVFRRGRNGQLEFRCVSDWIDTDLGLMARPIDPGAGSQLDCLEAEAPRSKFLDPLKFTSVVHSITLSKLALLDRRSIVDVADAASVSPGLGKSMKLSEPIAWQPAALRSNAGRYSAILDTPLSLDGSYQWQGYAMPYPRRAEFKSGHKVHGFGFPVALDDQRATVDGSATKSDRTGFPFYQTEALRTQVFQKLFPSPFEGAILGHPAMQSPRYRFSPCTGDPFRPGATGLERVCRTMENP